MKKIIGLSIFVIVAMIVWHFSMPAEKYSAQLSQDLKNFASSSSPAIKKIEDSINAPPPLKLPAALQKNPSAQLTVEGVISQTNLNRQENGNLAALKENATLDEVASKKVNDMLEQQYFEHINPQGKGPSDIVTAAGYEYISVGENLALGDFTSDTDLVTAWMNSPGHRANILNKSYEEIGVAVGQGIYKGQKTWLAVQEFGKPKSSCPTVSAILKSQIEQLQTDINQTQPQLNSLKSQIDSSNPQSQSDYATYNQTVSQYNDLVHEFNNKVDSLKLDTQTYNAQVNAYNSCLAQ